VVVQTDAIQSELERIVSSKEFATSPRLVRFLRYCVEQSHAGCVESLKESVIGVNVFDRAASYDPKVDPIVRVHARRLREKLDAFYISGGALEIVIQIPKGGYVARFAEVPLPASNELRPAALTVAQTSGTELAVTQLRRSRRTLSIALLLGAVFAFGVAAFSWRASQRVFVPAIQPLVSLPGSANDPAWAPDGTSIAFTWDSGGSEAPFVFVLKKGETVPSKLTAGNRPEHRPVWSPDGTQIALLREESASHFAIVRVDSKTKAERVVRKIVQLSTARIAPALDWSSNGQWLVTSEQPSEGTSPAHLLLVSPQDGRSWVITDPPNGSTGDLEARFTPDSKRILFRRGGHGELLVLSLSGTTAAPPTQVTFQNAGVRGLSVSRDGKTIYFGSQREYDRFGIWRLRDGEGTPVRITPEGMAALAPSIDPAGRSLAFAQPVIDVNLWMYDVDRSWEPRLLVPSTQAEYSPEFSPDGQKLAFISDRSGAAEIWMAALNGGQPRKITSLMGGDVPMSPAWSPDGSRIAFFCRRQGLNYAYETEIATGSTRPLRGGEDYALFPQYSSDGKSLYYVSNAGHRFRIWRETVDASAGAEPSVADEVRFFRISKDRRYIYFLQYNHPERLIQMNLATKEENIVWTFTDSLGAFDTWDVTGSRLFYVCLDPSRSFPQLVIVDLNSGERRVLGALRRLSHEWQTSIAASPDGQSVVVTQVDSDDTRLMLLQLGQ
jgi:Tol biopolymer transport system component